MEKRDKIIAQASWVSIVGNFILSASEIFVGVAGGSLAVLGDGIDSAVDVVISAVMIFTARIMRRPPNKKYVYGYVKAEGIATKILSLAVLYAGMTMLIKSLSKIFSGVAPQMPEPIVIWVTIFSIAGKFLLSWSQQRAGKRAESQLLIANAVNMRTDVLISCGVLVGLFFTFILKLPILDTITGLVISLFIIRSAIGIFMKSSVELMDGIDDADLYHRIFEAVGRIPEAGNPHRVRSRKIGGHHMMVLDIEVDGGMTVSAAHDIAHRVEESIRSSVENVYDIVVHVEPAGCSHPDEPFGVDPGMFTPRC